MYKLSYLLIFAFLFSCDDPDGPIIGESEINITIQDVTRFEMNENNIFDFQVFLSESSTEVVTVDFETEGDTAEEEVDFLAQSGQLTFAAGEKIAKISIEIIGDEWKESDEQFFVQLSNPVNGLLAKATATATIRNEDTTVDIPEDGYITPESYGGYTLNWQDEFEGDALDLGCWTHEIGNSGWGNNESQYYTDEDANSYIDNGNLIIEAIKEQYNGAEYTSARIVTQDKKLFTHGRVDIRAILPEGQGIWPALWMLGTNIDEIGWPACGEIDIMELVGHQPGTSHGTAHWGNQGQGFSTYDGDPYNLTSGEKFSDEYHVFSLIWEPGSVKWYVDDNEFFNINQSDVNVNYPFDQDFFFIFNIAVGGNWPGYPDASTQFPQQMIIDYIRVFDKN